MKKLNMHLTTRWALIVFILGLFMYAPIQVNGQKKERTRLKAYYEKLSDNNKKVSIILTQGKGKNIKGVGNAEIALITFDGDSSIEMGTIKTDTLGEAKLIIESGYPFALNEDGYAIIELSYDGDDSLRGSSKEIEFMDLNVELSLAIEDSVKLAEITAWEMGEDGSKQPIEDLKFKLGVKRLYNNLYLTDITTDESGWASFEFPYDIPGDSAGLITIVAKLLDHDDYGTVTQAKVIEWGTPVNYSNRFTERSLFGDSAPLWMIIAVAVILVGAWVHFLWAVVNVVRIKKLA